MGGVAVYGEVLVALVNLAVRELPARGGGRGPRFANDLDQRENDVSFSTFLVSFFGNGRMNRASERRQREWHDMIIQKVRTNALSTRYCIRTLSYDLKKKDSGTEEEAETIRRARRIGASL